MKESIHKYFKIGTIQWMSFPGVDVVDTIKRIARDDYFDAIEITQIKDSEKREKAKKILSYSHMTVCYGAQPRLLGPGLNPNAIEEEDRIKAEKTLLEAIDDAFEYGAPGIAFLAGKWDEKNKEKAYAQLLKTTRTLCSYAATKGMRVEIEVFDYNVDKAALIGPAPLAKRFAEDMRITHSNFGLLVDLSHFPITFENSKFVIQTCKPYITHLHFGNAVPVKGKEGYGDAHQRFGFPNGANDVDELVDFLTVLKDEGFFNEKDPMVLSLEVKPWGDEDAEIILANTKRVLNRAWALV